MSRPPDPSPADTPPQPASSTRVVVTADDFGIGLETSRGILDAVRAGAVHQISVMVVTGDHLQRCLDLLPVPPALPVGLHLTLSSRAGEPLTASRRSGLVARDGSFVTLSTLLLRGLCRRLDTAAVADEVLAQLERFRRLFGRPPDHLDGHQHAHQIPQIAEVIRDLLAGGLLPRNIRVTTPPVRPLAPRQTRREVLRKAPPDVRRAELWVRARLTARRTLIHQLGRYARPHFSTASAQLSDGFLGIIPPPRPPPPRPCSGQPIRPSDAAPDTGLSPRTAVSPWRGELERVGCVPGRFEMMVHPGHPDPSLEGRDPYQTGRVNELRWLVQLGPAVHLHTSQLSSGLPDSPGGKRCADAQPYPSR